MHMAENKKGLCRKGQRPETKYRITAALSGSTAAGTGSAGAGTATTTADRIGRGDGETRAVTGIDKVNLDVAATVKQIFLDQKSQVIFSKRFVIFFWLIQSQSQRGTSSAALHQRDADSGVDIVL